jgi:hypothetical protein
MVKYAGMPAVAIVRPAPFTVEVVAHVTAGQDVRVFLPPPYELEDRRSSAGNSTEFGTTCFSVEGDE